MCFSAEASFSIGAILLPAGAYCVAQSIKKNPTYLAFAVMPVMFGAQQLSEGFVWLGLQNGDASLQRMASLFFLFFALVVWPFWIGFSTLLVEGRPLMQRAFGILAVAGLAFGLLLFVPIFRHSVAWLTISAEYHSLRYNFETLAAFQAVPSWIWQCLYIAIVLIPLATVKIHSLRVFGILVGFSAVLSHLAYWYAFVSVWCMFSATLSVYLVYLFTKLPERSSPTRSLGHVVSDPRITQSQI